MRRPALVTLLGSLLLSTACVSSGSYERLERQNQLSQLEKANVEHARKGLERDLKAAQDQTRTLERRLASTSQAGEDKAKAARELQAQLDEAQGRIAALEAQMARVREALASGALERRVERERLQAELEAAPAAGGITH